MGGGRAWRDALQVIVATAALTASFDAWAGEHANVRVHGESERRRLESVLDRAARRLGTAGCAETLASFDALDGRSLAEVLAAFGQEPERYLDSILFYDGDRNRRCANDRVLAVTNPGVPIVLICSKFYPYSWRDPDVAEATLVHEAFHTLGLGENPPSSREITEQVLKKCR